MSGEGQGRDIANEINVDSLDEPKLPVEMVQATQHAWKTFISQAVNRDAAGEAIYAAIFEAAPSLQPLFKTPRAVMAIRFMMGCHNIIMALENPKQALLLVETLAFQHLELEVTVPRIVLFRDAIIELFETELSPDIFNSVARTGLACVLNYAGGAFVYTRITFADRLRIISSSWATANNRKSDEYDEVVPDASSQAGSGEAQALEEGKPATKVSKVTLSQEGKEKSGDVKTPSAGNATNIPTTFNEMFQFNSAVMGFGGNLWMQEVLASFDTIVLNVANSNRLQEECDVLSLRMTKVTRGPVNLGEFKAVMLASLRSLVPKDWNSAHEVAWNWLWENVERMLVALLGKPNVQLKALEALYASLTDDQLVNLRKKIYANFFSLAPAGQDFFKQSSTRLNFIADRVLEFTTDIFRDPSKLVNTLSALGLRHVGYGIPTELFGAFVTGSIEAVKEMTEDQVAVEAFRWSLGLVSRILVRTINEGSTIVMKAINANSGRQLRKAVSCAPRGVRTTWMLDITVGTQFISPLLWAVESGSWEAGKAIIEDILTIRADRDRYYYGLEELFDRHPDIIRILSADAPALLPALLDGLIWRSRMAEKGRRRVNYYVKYLIMDKEKKFSKALEWIARSNDPKIVCHPAVAIATDTIWNGIAYRSFIISKLWFILIVALFILSQAILERVNGNQPNLGTRVTILVARIIIYVGYLGSLLVQHSWRTVRAVCDKDLDWSSHVPIPKYLFDWKNALSLLLAGLLLLMLIYEPIIYCQVQGSGVAFDSSCPYVMDGLTKLRYSVWSMLSMLVFFVLIMDLTVFSNKISSFVLVCTSLVPEVALFLTALAFCLLAFSAGLSALQQQFRDFQGIPMGMLSLFEVALTMYPTDEFLVLDNEPILTIVLIIFVIIICIFLLNLLIAQLNTAYGAIFQDMEGYARLNRTRIITETMVGVPPHRWDAFLESLKLDERLEFNQGDVGLPGGIQIHEAANLNLTTVDTIKRVGGSTSPKIQWPEEEETQGTEEDKFDRVEKLLGRFTKRITGSGTNKRSRGGGSKSDGSSMLGSTLMTATATSNDDKSQDGSEGAGSQ